MSLLRVRDSISFDIPNEGTVVLRRGELFPADHPYVKGREQCFEPAENAAAKVPGGADAVETADAPPGVRRNVTAPPRRRED
jgi:hypothetical protein